jgi:hypothetical protein
MSSAFTFQTEEISSMSLDHTRGGRKKKKKKPTEWFLRQKQKEKEMREKGQQLLQQQPRELLPCLFYHGGKCAKVRNYSFIIQY